MTVVVRLFAILRERAGRDTISLELPDGATVADALDALALRPLLAETLARLPVRMAVNHEYAAMDDPIGPGDELALIPPISGGAPEADPADAPPDLRRPRGYKSQGERLHSRVTDEPLSADALTALVADPAAGAIVTFQGVTRDVASLDYEAYREMAEAKIAAILAAAAERHELLAAAAEHRVGNVPLGAPGVVVAVSAGHREEAFAGAREAIDRIKAEAPIWKRELDTAGGGEWVDGAPAPEPEATP